MKMKRPSAGAVSVQDGFWTPYLDNIRTQTIAHVFRKFDEIGYPRNYEILAGKTEGDHSGPHFANGLLLESIRGVSDFLAASPDPVLSALLDPIVENIAAACQRTEGLPLSYNVLRGVKPWDTQENIIYTHDLYNIGTLVEAGVQHYLATGKQLLLKGAMLAAARVCREVGAEEEGKRDIVPGHSLPEEAFLRLYRLLRDHRELDALASDVGCHAKDCLHIVKHWYEARGRRDGRYPTDHDRFPAGYNQDHAPFASQREAVGHAVRATLCYTGAAALTYETGNDEYLKSLDAIWDNIVLRKMHISGGIGTRHDIEGFDDDYNLPNGAYLETCASVGLMFFAGEMALLRRSASYYDIFEEALYNTILASIGEDGKRYFYQNPLQSDGSIRRWDWHGCPCCPPMLLKLLSSLSTYIYTTADSALDVNLLIGSTYETEALSVTQAENTISVDSHGAPLTLRIRIPAYAEQFTLFQNGTALTYPIEDGYALLQGIFTVDHPISVSYEEQPYRVCANPAVKDDIGRVCIMRGRYLMCAEGFDNDCDVDFVIAKEPNLRCDGDRVIGLRADGGAFTLIPYYTWCRRESEHQEQRRMNVWFRQEDMLSCETLDSTMKGALYENYETILQK